MLKLYTHFRSSAAFRVRIALNLKGLAYESVAINFARGEHQSAGYRGKNPQGLVPALDHDGTVLTQSLAIIEYLDAVEPAPRLIPLDPVDRARMQAMAQTVACDTHPLNNLRVLKFLRERLALDDASVDVWYDQWIAQSFAALEILIGQYGSDQFCYGNAVSLADVLLVPQVYNARRFDCDLAPYPALTRAADHLRELPEFARAAPEAQDDAVT